MLGFNRFYQRAFAVNSDHDPIGSTNRLAVLALHGPHSIRGYNDYLRLTQNAKYAAFGFTVLATWRLAHEMI